VILGLDNLVKTLYLAERDCTDTDELSFEAELVCDEDTKWMIGYESVSPSAGWAALANCLVREVSDGGVLSRYRLNEEGQRYAQHLLG
jgi:hypothetical protein